MRITLVPSIDCSSRLLQRVQTLPGQLGLIALVWLLLQLLGYQWPIPTTLVLAGFILFPQWRWELLSCATVGFWVWGLQWFDQNLIQAQVAQLSLPAALASVSSLLVMCVAIILIGCINLLMVQLRGLGLRPMVAAIGLYGSLCLSASYLPMAAEIQAGLWILLIYWSRFFWFSAYSLHDLNRPMPSQWRQLSYALPFWSPSDIPYPKATAYLQRIEAKTPQEAALSQLKGVKLLYWALWLVVATALFKAVFYGYAELLGGTVKLLRQQGELSVQLGQDIWRSGLFVPQLLWTPEYFSTFDYCAATVCVETWTNWKVISTRFIEDLLWTAVMGHVAVGIIRVAGFNALRNTVNPVASRSIADFWNRYQYYYKEMLVNLFYFPTFLRLNKLAPWLRIYLALLVAVCFGNFLFHLVRGIESTMRFGVVEGVWQFRGFFLYTLVLAHGIFLSQWLGAKRKGRKHPLERWLVTPVVVLGFFCLATVFVDHRRGITIESQLKFLLSLFGLS